MNQMRGFLLERGITMRKGPSHLAAQLQIIFGAITADQMSALSSLANLIDDEIPAGPKSTGLQSSGPS